VVRRPGAPEVPDFTNSHGPTCTWLCKFSVRSFTYRFFVVSVCSLSLIFESFSGLVLKGRRRRADRQQALGGILVVVLWLRDVLWIPGGRGVEVPDPPRDEDRDATVEDMSRRTGACALGAPRQAPS
jgi:hypothetical protein